MQGVIIGVGNNNNPHVQRQIASPPPLAVSPVAAPAAAIPGQVGIPSPAGMSTPAVNDSIINRKADPAQGLYQTCLALRERLRDVPDFEKFLAPPEDADPREPEDPVTQLWRCFRLGSSLCVLFNATRPVTPIPEDRCQPQLKTMNDCKAATFHFLSGIKNALGIDGDDAFMISHLYSDDTNGFVKVGHSPPLRLGRWQSKGCRISGGPRLPSPSVTASSRTVTIANEVYGWIGYKDCQQDP